MARFKKQVKLNGMPISDTAIRQPVFITMLMVLVITFGLLAFRTLPVNLLPDFEIPIVAVSIVYPGAGPESVADQVARPIEDAISTINGLENVTTTANEGQAIIVAEFVEGTDLNRAEQDVREKVNAVVPRLPRDVLDPVYSKFDPNDAAILSVAVAATDGRSSLEVRKQIEDDIVPRLQRIPGVGSVTLAGGNVRQINVNMDLEKLRAYQILPVQITRSIQQANANLGLGTITSSGVDISLRAPSMLQQPSDIANIQITGTSYRIGDVATIEDGIADVTRYSRLDGIDTIVIDVRKQSGANTVQVAGAVKAELTTLFENRTDLTYTIPRDNSEAVVQSTISSIEELIFASIAALAVVMLFFSGFRKTFSTLIGPLLVAGIGLFVLPTMGVAVDKVAVLAGSIVLLIVLTFFRDRNTLVTMAGLPVILIGTFAVMPLFGLSINLITLLALALCVGLVIDDAIVVRENIFRHMQRGEDPEIASSRGTAEVALSVLAMTFTVVAVFVPVTFTSGTTGIIFKSFGITIAIAIILSLIEAFLFAPMLSARLFKRQKAVAHEVHHHDEQLARAAASAEKENDSDASLLHEAQEDPGPLGRAYERILAFSLRSIWTRLAVVVIAVAVLVGSFGVASGLKFSFFPQQDAGELLIGFEMPAGTTLAETNRLAVQAEAVIMADPAIETLISSVGFTGNPERSEFFVKLKEHELTPPVRDRLRGQLQFLPKLVFGQPGVGAPSSTGISGRELQLSIQTTGSVRELTPFVEQVLNTAASVPGVVDLDTTLRTGKPELRFVADPSRIGDLGITNDDIASSVRALINGDRATVLRQDGNDSDIVVRLKEADRSSVDALQNIIIPTRIGPVPLSSLGTVEVSSGPTTLRRYNRLNQVLIGANMQDRNLAEAQSELNAKLQAQGIPDTVVLSYVGVVQQQTEGFGGLLLAMGLSVLFVYMVLASQFGSFTQPLVIMMAMPFSFIGAFIGLRLTNTDLDITGMIGLIMLLGIVVKNSILLVDFTNRLRRTGLDKHSALELAGAIRLRPILMTTLALVAGAIPVAMGIHIVGTGEGGEFRKGLATVLIGGLLTSMFLTLLVVPTAYSLMDSFVARMGRLFKRDTDEHEEESGMQPVLIPALAAEAANGGMAVATTNGKHGATNGHAVKSASPEANGTPAHESKSVEAAPQES